MLRSATTVLLASAPLVAAVPAQAATQQNFPCAVGIQKFDNSTTSTITLTVQCNEARTVAARVTADGVQLANLQQTVQANVRQSFTVVVPRASQVCATLESNGGIATVCTP
jgi:hypothetical protein